jgi:hypothetical protein
MLMLTAWQRLMYALKNVDTFKIVEKPCTWSDVTKKLLNLYNGMIE